MSVTLKYPFERREAPEEYRGAPVIDGDRCIGCGACSRACPPDAILVLDDMREGFRRVVLDVSRCIRCARCEEVCPTGALRLSREFELATPRKEDLVQVVKLRLARCVVCGNYCDFTVRQVEKALEIVPEDVREAARERISLCRACRRRLLGEDLANLSTGLWGGILGQEG